MITGTNSTTDCGRFIGSCRHSSSAVRGRRTGNFYSPVRGTSAPNNIETSAGSRSKRTGFSFGTGSWTRCYRVDDSHLGSGRMMDSRITRGRSPIRDGMRSSTARTWISWTNGGSKFLVKPYSPDRRPHDNNR